MRGYRKQGLYASRSSVAWLGRMETFDGACEKFVGLVGSKSERMVRKPVGARPYSAFSEVDTKLQHLQQFHSAESYLVTSEVCPVVTLTSRP